MEHHIADSGAEVAGRSVSWTVDLPWPPKELSPNARQHWAAAARAKKAFRARCRAAGIAAGVGAIGRAVGRGADVGGAGAKATGERPTGLEVRLTFVPPDKRARDWDNLLASMKAGLDGLADAVGVDDRAWRLSFEVSTQVEPGGRVIAQVTGRAARDAGQGGRA